jgi:hypothetical protein
MSVTGSDWTDPETFWRCLKMGNMMVWTDTEMLWTMGNVV